jgi:hypothetical protein
MSLKADCVGGPLDGESTNIVEHEFWVPVDGDGKIYTTADALNTADRSARYKFDPEKGQYIYVRTEGNKE